MTHILRQVLVGMFACLALAEPASAHRQPEVYGRVVYSMIEDAAVTKVTWRLHAHDAIKILSDMPQATSPNLEDETNLATLAAYIARVVVYKETTARTLGAEVEGNYVYIYQLLPGHAHVAHAAILSEISPTWSNILNVTNAGGIVETTIFSERYPHGHTEK